MENKKNIILKGKRGSFGITIGKVCLANHGSHLQIPKIRIFSEEEKEAEIKKLFSVLKNACEDLKKLKEKVKEKVGEAEAEIFETHILILQDPNIIEEIKSKIKEENKNLEWAIAETFDIFIKKFQEIENEYFKERSHDLIDLKNKLLNILSREDTSCQSIYGCKQWEKETVIACKNLLPSFITTTHKNNIKAIVIEEEVTTSHAAIISRALGIPFLTGVKGLEKYIYCGMPIIVDADNEIVILNPDENYLKKYLEIINNKKRQLIVLKKIVKSPSLTTDGKKIELLANVGNMSEFENLCEYKPLGIGLLRTEFLFIHKHVPPTEEEQYQIYHKIHQEVLKNGCNVNFRVLDIGGDKKVKYFQFDEEENPYMGIRGIRLLLREKELFKTQLKALYRLSLDGEVKIMYPMVSSWEELNQIKEIHREIEEELKSENKKFIKKNIKNGIMIEVPSIIFILDKIIDKIDFVSIGTNDLIQYTMAIDRGNKQLASKYSKFHPAIAYLIKKVCQISSKNRKECSICGELAADPRYTMLLIGLGVDKLSMTANMIPYVKDIIIHNSLEKAKEIADKVLSFTSEEEVENLLDNLVIEKELS